MIHLKSLISAYILSALVLSCGDKEKSDGETFVLEVTPSTQRVEALGERKTFTVSSSTDWYTRSGEAWAKVMTASGKSGKDMPLVVEVEENKSQEPRTAEITISNLGQESVTVRLEQAAGDGSVTVRGIATAEDLLGFAKAVNGEGSIARYLVDGVVKILNDIDASSITEWIPAGTETSPLTYSINGNNRTISNINWTVDTENYPLAGFVGCAKNITVSKLTLGSEGSKMTFTGNPSGKVCAGGIVARAEGVTMERVTNNASLIVSGTSARGENLMIGGLAGYADAECVLGGDVKLTKGCVNNGNVTVSVAAREGGLVGHNEGVITNCSNYGTITGPIEGGYGPGWLCSYNRTKASVTSNFGYGFVGPSPAMMMNAMMNYEDGYDLENNIVDWTLDAYYDWNEVETRQLHSGAVYHHYSCINVPRQIHVLEIDLTDPGIEINSSLADDLIPNPNGNNNTNNGFKIRETLSMVCNRKRSEGQKILAGVNACFFDSHNGISRGFHVENGEPVYINSPTVVKSLVNHSWGFTVFTDGTASCGKKAFTGTLRTGGREYSFYTVNDTTLRHASPTVAPVNLFTSRYVRFPHPSYENLVNDLASNVLYVICEYTGDPMKVNTGYAPARVIDIRDGRSGIDIEKPYLAANNQVGIALSGGPAVEWADFIKVNDTVELKCDIAIDSDSSKPILALDSTMYQLMTEGEDATSMVTSTNLLNQYDPMTFPVISADRRKVWIVEIDGRQDWYSIGVKAYELYRIAKKLGGWWTTRFDGGGSAAMWVWNPATSTGGLVSSPSDTNGERSSLSYIILKEK